MIPDELYENGSSAKQIISEAKVGENAIRGWRIEDIEYGDGIRLYIEGAEYPQKGYAKPEALFATNLVKRLLLNMTKLFTFLDFFPFLFVLAPRRSRINALVSLFLEVVSRIMSPHILKYRYLSPAAQGVQDMLRSFFREMGIEQAEELAKIVSHMIEYDLAYRFRLQDLAAETSKEALIERPGKEIRRLLGILKDRETLYPEVARKFRALVLLASILLAFPGIRRAFRKSIDLSKLKIDHGDMYWMCIREDYKFLGLTIEERHGILKGMGLTWPKGEIYNL